MNRPNPGCYLPLYLVTDTRQCGSLGVAGVAGAAVAGGATVVQVRDKAAAARDLLEMLAAVAEAVGDRVPVLVNDRVDIFLAARMAGAQVAGVHVGQSDLPVELARAMVGPEAVVGLSAATEAEIKAAHLLPSGTVDYLGVGAIRATTTKADHPPPLGLAGFRALTASSTLPCVAIGGVGTADVRPLRQAGAAGVAVASAICTADNPRVTAERLKEEWCRTGL